MWCIYISTNSVKFPEFFRWSFVFINSFSLVLFYAIFVVQVELLNITVLTILKFLRKWIFLIIKFWQDFSSYFYFPGSIGRYNNVSFIIQGVRTIVFIFMVIFTAFRSMCLPAFCRCFLSNSGAYTELRTTSFI